MSKKVLGILGGIGPMSSAYFYKLITEKTDAKKDQEHIDIIISSKASIPDRTAFILGESDENPLPVMLEEAKKMQVFGAEIIAMTCNTAHFFYEKLQEGLDVPLLNIGKIAVENLQKQGIQSIGLMATTGTVKGGIYQNSCDEKNMTCITPNDLEQEQVMDIIYKDIKAGKNADMDKFFAVANSLKSRGAEAIILACTELSLIKSTGELDKTYVDPLEILAEASIEACGYKVKGEKSER